MKKRNLYYFIVLIFIIAFFLPQVVFFFVKDHLEADTSEKRVLAEKPVFSLDSIEDYPSEFENYWNDHIPFRNELKKLWGNLNFVLFNESTTDQVTIGKNDGDKAHTWLFYSTQTNGDPMADVRGISTFSQEEKEIIFHSIQSNTDALAAKDIELYYMLIPNKGNVYKEKLPDSISIVNEISRTEELAHWLTSDQDISNLIYIKSALMDAKETADTYFRQDTHWNDYGAFVGFRELMQLIEPELKIFDNVEIIIPPEQVDVGDLKSTLNISYPILENNVTVGGFLEECGNYTHRSRAAAVETNELSYNRNAPIKKMVLLVGDSFGYTMQPYFSKTFQKVRIIHKETYQPDILEKYQPDIVVFEAVERLSHTLSMPLS